MQWFEEWFDSPYYQVLYANRDEQEAEKFINKVVEKLQIPANAKILDVACGKGRHSRTLAKLGYDVTGIDLSHNNIAYAKQFENEHLHFEQWDMRNVFRSGSFDYAFNLFSSFGYFDNDDDDMKAVRAFAENLKPGGTLLLDYLNSECAVKLLKSNDIIPRGEIHFHIQKKIENGFIKKKIEFIANGEHHSYEEHLKIINLFKFKAMLTEAGFELQETYGNYALEPFKPHESMRLILVAKKVT
jgi:2-polyprenyl-3-methyl-5-hydroxy-6-metoxy-1,4-benzoquinol methylase